VERPNGSLDLLVNAVLDGDPIDWASTESSASGQEERAQIREFRTLAAVAALHREPESTDTTDPIPDTTAELWGSLRLLERIGAGSFGEVYRAWDRRLDREVALKLLRSPTVGGHVDSGVVDEGRLLARVRHPNVVTVHGADVVNGQVGIWMELIRGQTLEACVRESGPFDWRDAAAIGTTICRALDAVHAAGLMHRDINAKNVMREDDGRIVLMDFGAGQTPADDRPGLVGTPLYLAPELFEGGAANRTTDIYSVGVLLYHLVTGSYPIVGQTLDEIRNSHRHVGHAPLRDDRSDLPEDFVVVIERAIEPNPSQRFGSASALGAALEATLTAAIEQPTAGEKPVAGEKAARPTAEWSGWRTIWARVALGLSVIALVGLVAAAMYASVWRGRGSAGSDVVGRAASEPLTPSATPSPATVPRQTEVVEPLSAALRFQGRDWVLITAFENRTGENVFDGTLEYALERELSNSPFVNVAPRERIDDVLRLMRKPTNTTVDPQLGREICLRDGGIRALLTGRVEKIGTAYVLTAQIVNPVDAGVMISLTQDAARQADLLQAVQRQAFRVREALGEMMSTIQRSQVELEKVTTPSLHALQLYSRASAFMHGEDWKEEPAEELLTQAVTEDPEFPSAYILLAHAIHNQGRPKEEFMQYASRAAELATQTTDVERYFILGSYHGLIADTAGPDAEAERRKAISAYEALVRIKPDHYWGVVNLAFEVEMLSGNDRATAEASARAADIRPKEPLVNLRASRLLAQAGDLGRARRYLRRAQASASASSADFTHLVVGYMTARYAMLDGDVVRARQIADAMFQRLSNVDWPNVDARGQLRGQPGNLFGMLNTVQMIYLDLGRFDDARKVEQGWAVGTPLSGSDVIGWARMLVDTPGAKDSRRDFVSARYRDVERGSSDPLWALYARSFYQLGMVDELRDMAAKSKEPGRRTSAGLALQIDGLLALAEGRVDEGARLFQSAKQAGFKTPWSSELNRSDVAAAWKTRGGLERAAEVLETTRNDWPRVVMADLGLVWWIPARDRLSNLYRSMGRVKEADEIDAELLKVLAVADTDHPVFARIKARQNGF
jgi:serine/threonine-protein kinase